MQLLAYFIYQIVFTAGIIVLFGFLIALCRRAFCHLLGAKGYKILLATGIVGTPVHELSHALMCVIFGHKITAIKLYDPNAEDGALGYVSHAYNKRNFYQQIGNFFIGVAPVLCGSGILLLLMFLLTPTPFSEITAAMGRFVGMSTPETGIIGFDIFLNFFVVCFSMIGSIFQPGNLLSFRWWLFILLAIMIAGHMELSGADIKSGILGFLFVAAGLFIVDLILNLISQSLIYGFTSGILMGAMFIACMLMLATLFNLLLVLIALIAKGISKACRKKAAD